MTWRDDLDGIRLRLWEYRRVRKRASPRTSSRSWYRGYSGWITLWSLWWWIERTAYLCQNLQMLKSQGASSPEFTSIRRKSWSFGWVGNKMTYNGKQAFIYPDYTAEVIAQRRGFHQVTQALKEREVKFTLRFPAKLHVYYNDQVKVFTSPGEAMSFIEYDMKR